MRKSGDGRSPGGRNVLGGRRVLLPLLGLLVLALFGALLLEMRARRERVPPGGDGAPEGAPRAARAAAFVPAPPGAGVPGGARPGARAAATSVASPAAASSAVFASSTAPLEGPDGSEGDTLTVVLTDPEALLEVQGLPLVRVMLVGADPAREPLTLRAVFSPSHTARLSVPAAWRGPAHVSAVWTGEFVDAEAFSRGVTLEPGASKNAPARWARTDALPVTLVPGESGPIPLELLPAGGLTVRIVDERGLPVPGARVALDHTRWTRFASLESRSSSLSLPVYQLAEGPTPAWAPPLPGGGFETERLRPLWRDADAQGVLRYPPAEAGPGSGTLTTLDPRTGLLRRESVAIDLAPAEVLVTLPAPPVPGTLSVEVLDAAGLPRPYEGPILVYPEERRDDIDPARTHRLGGGPSAADRTFALPQGSYQVALPAGELAHTAGPFAVRAGERTAAAIPLPRPGRLVLRLDPETAPRAPVAVTILCDGSAPRVATLGPSDEHALAAAGSVRLSAAVEGRAPFHEEVAIPEGGERVVSIRFERAAAVRVEIQSARGETSDAAFYVELRPAGAPGESLWESNTSPPGEPPGARFTAVPAGPFEVRLQGSRSCGSVAAGESIVHVHRLPVDDPAPMESPDLFLGGSGAIRYTFLVCNVLEVTLVGEAGGLVDGIVTVWPADPPADPSGAAEGPHTDTTTLGTARFFLAPGRYLAAGRTAGLPPGEPVPVVVTEDTSRPARTRVSPGRAEDGGRIEVTLEASGWEGLPLHAMIRTPEGHGRPALDLERLPLSPGTRRLSRPLRAGVPVTVVLASDLPDRDFLPEGARLPEALVTPAAGAPVAVTLALPRPAYVSAVLEPGASGRIDSVVRLRTDGGGFSAALPLAGAPAPGLALYPGRHTLAAYIAGDPDQVCAAVVEVSLAPGAESRTRFAPARGRSAIRGAIPPSGGPLVLRGPGVIAMLSPSLFLEWEGAPAGRYALLDGERSVLSFDLAPGETRSLGLLGRAAMERGGEAGTTPSTTGE